MKMTKGNMINSVVTFLCCLSLFYNGYNMIDNANIITALGGDPQNYFMFGIIAIICGVVLLGAQAYVQYKGLKRQETDSVD